MAEPTMRDVNHPPATVGAWASVSPGITVVHNGEQVAPPVPQCTLNTHSFCQTVSLLMFSATVLANTIPSATVTPAESSVLTNAFHTGLQDSPCGAPHVSGKASISPGCPPLEK